MADPLLLYSTNTWLAYQISERYYDGLHYVWCSPFFTSRSVPFFDYNNPPTSTPANIYAALYKDTSAGDRHSAKIRANRVGIITGAYAKLRANVITSQQHADIASIVEAADPRDFRPLLYIVPFSSVPDGPKEVPIHAKAHPLAREYLIECLPRQCFDIIDFDWS